MKPTLPFIVGVSLLFIVGTSLGLGTRYPVSSSHSVTVNTDSTGKMLAARYCMTCHLLPEPKHLDRSTWISKVFPVMRQYMGMDQLEHREKLQHDLESFFPAHPAMTENEWYKIAEYYIDSAPQEFAPVVQPVATADSGAFTTHEIRLGISPPMTTLVKFDSINHQLIIGDAFTNQLKVCSIDGKVKHTIQLTGPPSSIVIERDVWYVTDMGKLLPHDSAIGSVQKIEWKSGKPVVSTFLSNLRRPTNIVAADLNADGIRDFIICEYGNLLGQLGWYEVKRNGKLVYHELLALPGAIKTEVADLNGDGRPDIVAQMAQAREGVFAFINSGKGSFTPQELITLPPSYGSSWFGFVDWNGDSYPDILLTTGDNGDYDNPPNKPYHGCHVYLGSKDMNYTKAEFFQMYGAYGAGLNHFSSSDKRDLFLFSYFPDIHLGDVGMIRLYNELPATKRAVTFGKAQQGRWLVFDIADVDSDGDMDIILGNVSYGPSEIPVELQKKWVEGGVSALLLKSNLKR